MQIGEMYIPFTWLAGGLALLLILIGVIGGRASRGKRQEQAAALNETVAARGWQHHLDEQGNRRSYHFSGTTDRYAWTVESTFRGDHDTTFASYTRWHTADAALPSGVIMLWATKGRKFPEGQVFKLPSIALKPLISELGVSEDNLQRLLDADPVEISSDEMARNYKVFTHDADVDSLLQGEGQAALLRYTEWANSREGQRTPAAMPKLIVAWDHGVTVLTEGSTLDPATIERIIDLGVALADQVRA